MQTPPRSEQINLYGGFQSFSKVQGGSRMEKDVHILLQQFPISGRDAQIRRTNISSDRPQFFEDLKKTNVYFDRS